MMLARNSEWLLLTRDQSLKVSFELALSVTTSIKKGKWLKSSTR